MSALSPRLARASEIVSALSDMALASWRGCQPVNYATKGTFDFVSEADTRIERNARQLIDAAFPGETVFGEEYGGARGDQYWVIDPIDGTRNFLRGSPLWAVSLGAMRDGVPDIGVIALPALGVSLAAERGFGMFLNGVGHKRPDVAADVRLISYGDDLHTIAPLEKELRAKGWVGEAYRATALGLSYAALGHVDGHIQNRVALWDMAAGLAVCTEAGLDCRFGGEDPKAMWLRCGTTDLMSDIDAA